MSSRLGMVWTVRSPESDTQLEFAAVRRRCNGPSLLMADCGER